MSRLSRLFFIFTSQPLVPSLPLATAVKRLSTKPARRQRLINAMASQKIVTKENGVEESHGETYADAIRLLNSLQSNAATVALARRNPSPRQSTSLSQTLLALQESGLSPSALASLPIIHVGGTKGKGTTCAFTESLLREAGLTTGFFSSPHLTSVRERLRLNGRPISESQFTRAFFRLWGKLQHLREGGGPCEMPPYFRFLTLMAFHFFLEENVDVLILEVGIGGTFDCTNIIPRPEVVGITTLALEHQSILGQTLPEIALQKAGIMKPSCPVFTVNSHPPQILEILEHQARNLGCPFTVVSPLPLEGVSLGVDDGVEGGVAEQNASLAIYLVNQFLLQRHSHVFPKLSMNVKNARDLEYSRDPERFLPFQKRGLGNCRWDGRYQKLEMGRVTWYLDGAHTLDSLKVTKKWFQRQKKGSDATRVLVFNVTGERNAERLLTGVFGVEEQEAFDLAIFSPMVAFKKGNAGDNWSKVESEAGDEGLLKSCRNLVGIWEQMRGDKGKAVCLGSAEETREYLGNSVEGDKVEVLVTGSLHLVGNFLQVLRVERNNNE